LPAKCGPNLFYHWRTVSWHVDAALEQQILDIPQ
jgi:hypothetical protein